MDEKAKGIHVQSAMAWLFRVLVLRAVATPPPCPESSDPWHFGGGSPNMKLLFSLLRYVYAVKAKSADLHIHRERMKNVLEREKTCWQQVEPTTSTHAQLWLAGVAGCLVVAFQAKHQELVDLAVWWLRIDHAIHSTAEFNGEMWCAGGRTVDPKTGKMYGSSSTRQKIWAAILTGKLLGKANQYDIAAALLCRLPEEVRARIREWPAAFPPMVGRFHAKRFEDGDVLTYYDALPNVEDPTFSAGVLNGVPWVSLEIDQEKLAAYEGKTIARRLGKAGADLGEMVIETEVGEPAAGGRKGQEE
jgi:hypothetical protein